MRKLTKLLSLFMAVVLVLCGSTGALASASDITSELTDDGGILPTIAPEDSGQIQVKAKSAILMEVTTGKVLYEMNSNEKRAPASITKVMTALLTMEAVEKGTISLTDMVLISPNAMAMGGTTIFLEAGETMSVDDLMKGLMVNSANDAAVALAEYISGTEEAFVALMNQRAQELGMNDTTFKNAHGLDEDGHMTTAHDIAVMSCELLKHEKIMDYTKIWTGSLRDGATGLANTNKLIRFYEPATGLKTGTTNNAGRCVSASAMKNDLHLVAVVLGGEEKNDQFNGARSMLEWGFANYALVEPPINMEEVVPIPVSHGMQPEVMVEVSGTSKILIEKAKSGELSASIELMEQVEAPVKKGQQIGKAVITSGDEILAEVPLVAAESVEKMSFFKAFCLLIQGLLAV